MCSNTPYESKNQHYTCKNLFPNSVISDIHDLQPVGEPIDLYRLQFESEEMFTQLQ